MHVYSEEELFNLESLLVTEDIVHKIETAKREQTADQEWHQLNNARITSSSCYVRGEIVQRMLYFETYVRILENKENKIFDTIIVPTLSEELSDLQVNCVT